MLCKIEENICFMFECKTTEDLLEAITQLNDKGVAIDEIQINHTCTPDEMKLYAEQNKPVYSIYCKTTKITEE